MFLDPEPRTSRRPQSQTDFQGFIPPLSPNDQRIIRKPLSARSPNQIIPKVIEDEDPFKPTVRLVRQTPSVASIRKEVFGETDRRVAQRDNIKLANIDTSERPRVAELQSPTDEDTEVDTSIDDSLQSAASQDLPPWKRRSVSSSNFSNATTLQGSEVARSAYASSQRLSSGTTVRELSTLHDTELEDLPESAEEAGPHDDTDFSLTTSDFEDSTAELQTIRPVLASIKSQESEVQQAETPRPRSRRASWSLESSAEVGSSPPGRAGFTPNIPLRISSRHAASPSQSTKRASISTPEANVSHSPALDPVATDSDLSPISTYSAYAHSPPIEGPINTRSDFSPNYSAYASSPNFIAYDSSPTRPRSRSHPLRGEASYESIGSRLQGISCSDRSLAPSASWSSLDPASSLDTLPSIHVPRRRLRHIRGSMSADLDRRSQDADTSNADSEPTLVPFGRGGFSGNLSTIASESERSRSRTVSNQARYYSTEDAIDESTATFSGQWSGHRLESMPTQIRPSRFPPGSSSEEEPGDMTLGLYREESAMPEPLFRAPSPTFQSFNKRYNGPLPPLPPIPPLHDEESHDTLAELINPSLKLKRSGYSLRHQQSNSSLRHQRSSSTPVLSRRSSIISNTDSDRWSSGSFIFPTWAWHFYSGNVALASMSQISLYPVPTPPTRNGAQNGMRFERFPSQRYLRATASPPSTGTSQLVTITPQSRHFLPTIFKPRARSLRIASTAETVADQVRQESASDVVEQRDSMAIEPIPAAEEVLPSGHPKYGVLKDEHDSLPQLLPRKYSKQKKWNDMTFPRPMSKDRITGVMPAPHLAPTKRSSAHISAWRPPSFVESIDLILKSRGHRQILFFLVGFVCPLSWMIGAFMPLPPRPSDLFDVEKAHTDDESLGTVMQRHEAGEAAARWHEEKAWRHGLWWRNVNRIMSVVGLFVIGAVIAIAVVATR